MIRAIKHLLGLAAREDAGTDELAPSLPAAEAELAAAQVAQTEAEAAYRASLLTPDEAASNRLDVARREAGVRIERATALIEALRQRLNNAQAREAEAARVLRYEEARQRADDAAAALNEFYPQMAEDLVKLLVVVAEADQMVQAANADRPNGADAIAPVENRVRSLFGSPEEVVHREAIERWVHVGQVLPGSFDQAAVRATGGGRGRLPVQGLPLNDGRQMELRPFVEERFFPADFGASPDRLAERLVLPGFRHGDADFFRPVDRPHQGTVQPGDVLARIAMLRAQAPQGAPQVAVQTRLIPEITEPVRPLSPPDTHRAYKGRSPDFENY